jgi:cobalt-zinc-cadmium efflux system protein
MARSDMASEHAHSHASHDHGLGSERRLGLVALLTGGFMVAEVAGGLISGSLALLADAGHMLTDFASLALAWGAARVARRPADWKRTYGFDRFSVLAAFVNGVALLAISAWIAAEAVRRFLDPVEVQAGTMLVIAALGLGVNVVAFRLLRDGHDHDLNTRSAALHVLGDMLGSVAAIAAALVILWTGWTPADPLLSVLVVLLILGAGWRVVRDSGRILLEAAPEGMDAREISADLCCLPGVAAVHHVHVWSISEKRPMITLEARLAPGADATAARRALRERLESRHGISHATIEIERPEEAAAGTAGELGERNR